MVLSTSDYFSYPLSKFILALVSTILVGCVAQSSSTNPCNQIYIAHNIEDAKSIKFSRDANYEIGKNVSNKYCVNIDILTGDRVKNIYSTNGDRAKIQQLDDYLKEVSPAEDVALIASVKRVQEIFEKTDNLTVYLIISGTSDRDILSQISAIAKDICSDPQY